MTKKSRFALLVAIAALLAVLLNPSPDKHRNAIKARIAERSQLERLLAIGPLTAFAVHYHSLGIASYTTLDGRLVSVGAYALVVVAD